MADELPPAAAAMSPPTVAPPSAPTVVLGAPCIWAQPVSWTTPSITRPNHAMPALVINAPPFLALRGPRGSRVAGDLLEELRESDDAASRLAPVVVLVRGVVAVV